MPFPKLCQPSCIYYLVRIKRRKSQLPRIYDVYLVLCSERVKKPIMWLGDMITMKRTDRPRALSCNKRPYDQTFRNALFNTVYETDILLTLEGALKGFYEQRPGSHHD